MTDTAITHGGLSFNTPLSSATSELAAAFWNVVGPTASPASLVVPGTADTEFDDEMDYIATLEDGWAGEDSVAPSKAALRNARRVASVFAERMPMESATANDTGTVSLEWTTPEGYCHLEIGNSRFAFTLRMGNGFRTFQTSEMRELYVGLADYLAGELFPHSSRAPSLSAS